MVVLCTKKNVWEQPFHHTLYAAGLLKWLRSQLTKNRCKLKSPHETADCGIRDWHFLFHRQATLETPKKSISKKKDVPVWCWVKAVKLCCMVLGCALSAVPSPIGIRTAQGQRVHAKALRQSRRQSLQREPRVLPMLSDFRIPQVHMRNDAKWCEIATLAAGKFQPGDNSPTFL